MPELTIFHKPQKGIFDEASHNDEGMIHDFNNLPTKVAVSPIPTLRIHNIHLQKSKYGVILSELIFSLGLQVKQKTDGIFISQDKYVADMLKKFDLTSVKTALIPMETKMALTKDKEANEVDVHLYRSMIVVAVDQSAGPTDQAKDQPSSSKPLPSSSHPPVISVTSASEPTPIVEPTTHHTSPSLEPDNEPTEHIFEQPSPEHQPLSPRKETVVPQSQDPTHPHVPKARTMTVEDLLHLVPNLITKVDSLETELKQTKLTMGNAIVKLVKKVKKLEDILKRRHVVLTDSEDEEPEDQGWINSRQKMIL
ncbi:hypothetical protein Tco_0685007 [Tanacetum coccineum]